MPVDPPPQQGNSADASGSAGSTVLLAEADLAGPAGPRAGAVGYALAALSVLTVALVAIDVSGVLRAVLVATSLLLVPGLALVRYLGRLHSWARWSMVIVTSLTIETLLALLMVWTGLWFPRLVMSLLLLVSAAVLIGQQLRRRVPAEARSAEGRDVGTPSQSTEDQPRAATSERRSGRRLLLAVACLLIPSVLWVLGLLGTRTEDLGAWGLLATFPLIWYVALVLNLAVLVSRLLHPKLSNGWLAAHLTLLIVMLYGSAALVEDAPRLPWAYKHIAVTRYVEANGSVNPDIDIYQRWPGFFAWTAQLGQLSGFEDPVSYAGYFEIGFALLDVLLVLAIARSLARDDRWCWIVAALFSVSNWVAQNYFAPQAFAYVMSLAVFLLVLTSLRHEPRQLGVRLEGLISRVFRGAPSIGSAVPPRSQPERPWAMLLVIVIFAAVVASHQLTPYLMLLALVPLFALGYLRPLWLIAVLMALTVLYLIPNLSYIEDRFGVISSFDPFANATFSASDRSARTPAAVWQGRGTQLLSAVMLLLAAVGLIRRVRAGYARTAALVGWLLVSPALILVVQSYGGEGRLRVYLFALPWICVAAAWSFHPSSSATTPQSGRSRVALAAVIGVLSTLFVLTYFQPEADYRVPRNEVVAAQWLDGQVARGDVVLLTAPVTPALIGPNYDKVVFAPLSEYKQYIPEAVTVQDALDTATSVNGGTAPSRIYLAFSDAQTPLQLTQEVFGPDEIQDLEQQVQADPTATRVYSQDGVHIYLLQPTR